MIDLNTPVTFTWERRELFTLPLGSLVAAIGFIVALVLAWLT